jgi:plastocyanin
MNTTTRYKFSVIAVCMSIAVALGFALYEGYLPVKDARNSLKQAAGQITSEGMVSTDGALLQRNLSGAEKPQESIHIETGTDVPRFTTQYFTVHAGTIIRVTLTNNSKVGHSENWALVKPGTRQLVEEAALRTPQPKGESPNTTDVLAFIPLTKPGQSKTRLFRAPDQPGDYPYLCTYAGRGEAMNGVLHVTG